ncbi:MAG: T9SS C-terminal target domain-containing protein [Bacteroidetes bacterium]|nr:MAG: T9SS C-terminal target domain-containing protein [Bacteroidota bacterium]
MKQVYAIVLTLFSGYFVFGQEVLTPLTNNPILKGYQQSIDDNSVLGKKQSNFPFNFPVIESFGANSLDGSFWETGNTTLQQGCVFNAQTSAGLTYSNGDGSFGVCDELTSKPMNMLSVSERCYFSFDVQTGATWQTNDSLVLQALNSAGNWDNIWTSPPILFGQRSFNFEFPLTLLYGHAAFKFRFVSYGTRTSSNTQHFILRNLVFGVRQKIPFADNIFWNATLQYRGAWGIMQGEQRSGVDFGLKWGNVIKLDGLNALNLPYNNGFTDTIQSQSFDLSGLSGRDSVYMRFFYKAISTSVTDSLLVFYKNNAGVWVRQFGVSAANSTNLGVYINNINRSRFNHQSFEFRIVTRGGSNAQGDTLKWIVSGFDISKKTTIPFLDDFSSSNIVPDNQKWVNRLVFVNNRFAINQPSVNVATFDGLNRLGVPYGAGRGYCDTLTSLPIRLDGLKASDSVYLSFWIQPGGLGAIPDDGDSLILEARYTAASADSFRLLWRGAPRNFKADSFTKVSILVPELYLHDHFEIRFKNIGSRTGNLAHWHIDYIRLDKGRTQNDALFDIAIQESPSPLLKKYTSMPYGHFKTNAVGFLNDTQYFTVKNNGSNNAGALIYGREVFNQEFTRLDTFGSALPQMPAMISQTANVIKPIVVNDNFTTDSVLIWSRFFTRLGTTIDNIRSNDTIWQSTYFGNYYAYDDGTAEHGYAIENVPGKVALRYALAKPDSLYGMAVHFNRGVTDVSNLSFDLMVWKNIGLTDEVLARIPASAVYYNARNGFHYVKFSEPIYIENVCYIGWEQTKIFPLNVGFDANHKVDNRYLPNPEMFYNVQGIWQKTEIAGALMMRPIVGKWIDPPPVGLSKFSSNQLHVTVYPNPSSGLVNISGVPNATYHVSVFDLVGKLQAEYKGITANINLGNLSTGIYLLHVTDTKTFQQTTKKITLTTN